MSDELIGHDAIALGELIRKGELSPVELLEVTIERIEKVNPRLNAVIHKRTGYCGKNKHSGARLPPIDGAFSVWTHTQPLESGTDTRWFKRWISSGSGNCADGSRK